MFQMGCVSLKPLTVCAYPPSTNLNTLACSSPADPAVDYLLAALSSGVKLILLANPHVSQDKNTNSTVFGLAEVVWVARCWAGCRAC